MNLHYLIARSGAVALLLLSASALNAQTLRTIPWAGGVTDTRARISVWLEEPGTVRLAYGTSATLDGATLTDPIAPEASHDLAAIVELTGLAPSTRYYYRVVTGSGEPISRIQSFGTFAPAGTDASATIFFGSCQQSLPTDSGRVFNVAADLGGDLFLQIGDWAYPDVRVPGYPSSDSLVRASYVVRLDTSYPLPRRLMASTPVAWMWDDHDAFGDNSNGASAQEIKDRVRAAYDRYVPAYDLPSRDGIWHSLRAGNLEIFILDVRSMRSPVSAAFTGGTFNPPAGHSMLAGAEFTRTGQDQVSWLMERVRNSSARWKVIASPVTFNPAMANGILIATIAGRPDIARRFAEYWAGYPADIDSIKTLIREGHLKNTLVISGGIHTNIADDGSHSLIPEFAAANLDIENTHLRDTLGRYGLNVWTDGQNNSLSTIGRIRVETTPRHRLIVDSFDELAAKQIELVLEDASASAPLEVRREWRVTRAEIRDGRLHLETTLPPSLAGRVTLTALDGATVLDLPFMSPSMVDAPASLPSGSYLGRLRVDEGDLAFKVVVTRQ